MTALAIRHLGHAFGKRQVLEDVGFEVPDGSFTVLLGPNGAGKTTLVALVTRLYHAGRGDIAVCGHCLRREPYAALAALGVVFQTPTLDLDLTVRENLRYRGALHGLAGCEAERRGAAELARMGLAERLGDRARILSGGLRRRLEIAAALLHRPRLLILDEATVGLDPASRAGILAHLRRLQREERLSLLWTTHLLDEAVGADQVVILHRGRAIWQGPAERLGADPSRLAARFLALTGEAA